MKHANADWPKQYDYSTAPAPDPIGTTSFEVSTFRFSCALYLQRIDRGHLSTCLPAMINGFPPIPISLLYSETSSSTDLTLRRF